MVNWLIWPTNYGEPTNGELASWRTDYGKPADGELLHGKMLYSL